MSIPSGCVLYRCLTGEVPFPRDSELVTIYAHLQDPAAAPEHRADPGPRSAMDRVIERAMAKSREERFATCLDLARAATAPALGATTPAEVKRPRHFPQRRRSRRPSPRGTGRGYAVRRDRRRRPAPRRGGGDVGRIRRSRTRRRRHRATPARGPRRVGRGRTSSPPPERSRVRLPRPRQGTSTIAGTTHGPAHPSGESRAILALGDNQYENGSYEDFATYYDPWWGQARSITEPVPGDREYHREPRRRPSGTSSTSASASWDPTASGTRASISPRVARNTILCAGISSRSTPSSA